MVGWLVGGRKNKKLASRHGVSAMMKKMKAKKRIFAINRSLVAL